MRASGWENDSKKKTKKAWAKNAWKLSGKQM